MNAPCVFVANSAWYLYNFRASTLTALRGDGHRVVCIVPEDGEPRWRERLEALGVECRTIPLQAEGTSWRGEGRTLLAMTGLLRRLRPRIVFSFNPKTNLYAALACRMLRLRHAPNISGTGEAERLPGFKGRCVRMALSRAFRRAEVVFFQNREDLQRYIESGWVRAEQAIRLPGSGVDLQRFHPPADYQHSSPGVRTFLMASRLIKAKGVEVYVEAAAAVLKRLPEGVRFLLVGIPVSGERGVDPAVIERFAGEPGCEFLGQVDDMPSLLRQCDCVVLPTSYPEGLPKVLLEGLASGCLIVTTRQAGCIELTDANEAAIGLGNGTVRSLAEALETIAGMPEVELRLRKAKGRRLAGQRYGEGLAFATYLRLASPGSVGKISSGPQWYR